MLTSYANSYILITEIRKRVNFKRKRGVEMALINLKKEMAGADVSIEAVAAAIGVHRNTASNKIDGTTKITFEEALTIRNKFFPKMGLEYLFEETK